MAKNIKLTVNKKYNTPIKLIKVITQNLVPKSRISAYPGLKSSSKTVNDHVQAR